MNNLNHLRYYVGWRNKSYTPDSRIQKWNYGVQYIPNIHFVQRNSISTDLVILTINALKIAVVEKNITNALRPRKYRLFTMMHTDFSNRISVTLFTITRFTVIDFCITLPWTYRTFIHAGVASNRKFVSKICLRFYTHYAKCDLQ